MRGHLSRPNQRLVVILIQHNIQSMFRAVKTEIKKENFSGRVMILKGKAGKATMLNTENGTPYRNSSRCGGD